MDITEVLAACREAGDAAISLRGTPIQKKADGSPVTDADLRASEILVERLSKSRYPVMSEEVEIIPAHKTGKAWIVDPLDGTSAFIAGDPHWAVMAALVENGYPILGVVYAPELRTLWHAEKGKGAFRERSGSREQVHVSSKKEIRKASMLLSQHHSSKESDAVAARLGAVTRRLSGFGVKACSVAEGAADLYWTEAHLGEWDVCAPHIIVQEAGGVFTDAFGNEIVYGSMAERPIAGAAVSNAELHAALAAAGRAVLDA